MNSMSGDSGRALERMLSVGGFAVSTLTVGRKLTVDIDPVAGPPAFAMNVIVPAVGSIVNELSG